MKQPHESWNCSAAGSGCIERERHGRELELFTKTKILNTKLPLQLGLVNSKM